ncbi:hypothetical protein IBA8402_49550 [Pseudomonas syringae]
MAGNNIYTFTVLGPTSPFAFAPTVSPDAIFVVYTLDVRRGAACAQVGSGDVLSLHKIAQTRFQALSLRPTYAILNFCHTSHFPCPSYSLHTIQRTP